MEKKIDWNYEGKLDFKSIAFGMGATKSERLIGNLSCYVIPLVIVILVWTKRVDWTIWQIIVALIMAYDIGGGLVANSLNACKRFYHAPLKSSEGRLGSVLKNKLLFASFHIHPIAAAIFWGWMAGVIWYLLFIVSAFTVKYTALYLKRPIAMLLILSALLISLYGLQAPQGLEWLMPALFIKIIYGHMVPEEPYR